MSKIYVTSDFHFGHEKFFIYAARGYQTIQKMNEDLVRKFNSVVSNDDDVYILGDLVLGDISNIEYVRELNGRLHVVLGNHDTNMRAAEYRTSCPNIVEVADVGIKLDYGKYHFALTHFPMLTSNIEKEYLKQMTLNLFGHTHQTTNFYNNLPFCYHVGVDSHNGYPVLLDDIIQEMKDKIKEPAAAATKPHRDPPDGGFYG